MQTIRFIVLTGGPCAGKSTAMSWIQNAFSERGYKVLFVPETATELINGGVAPWTCGTNADFQCLQFHLQEVKEGIFIKAAKTMKDEKILIVCDRGMMDNKVYMNDEELASVIQRINLDVVAQRDKYDAIFHLVTAAKGEEEIYLNNKEGNSARIETVEQACALDDKLIAAWDGHPHHRIIDNSSNFENKMKRLVSEIASFLGEPAPYEAERRFLIEYPNIADLQTCADCQKVEIIQNYYNNKKGDEIRVRQHNENGSNTFYKMVKKSVSSTTKITTEKRLTEKEYIRLLEEADSSIHQLHKTRYCFTYNNQYFEIDIFPFWKDKAIVKIELVEVKADVKMPDFLIVIKDVTGDIEYKNFTLAKNLTKNNE
ncbi:MAG: AAA family ATPase [Bacteroidaceae bacterium]|nr:AAA family ATPase [Bacteroidaceae bacterium]